MRAKSGLDSELSLPPHSRPKAVSKPVYIPRGGHRLHLLMGAPARPHCAGCGYREEGRMGASFAAQAVSSRSLQSSGGDKCPDNQNMCV